MRHIQLYMTIPSTKALGPYTRYALWVQGCPFRCSGCMTPDALSFDGGSRVPIEALAQDILQEPNIEGITISGGEPSHHAGAIADLVDRIREAKDLGVVVYSGYTLAQLQKRAVSDRDTERFLQSVDILVDGQFQEELNDGRSLRGSSNQQVHALTGRYRTVIDQYYGQPTRKVELHLHHEDIVLAGIPGKEALQQWKSRIRKGE